MAYINAEAEFALEQWGIWSRRHRPGPKDAISWMGPMIDRMVGQIVDDSGYPVQAWEDRDLEAFDSHIMHHIRANNHPVFQTLKTYYGDSSDEYRCVSKRELARRLKVNRDTAVKRLEIGINMVAAMLSMAA